MNTADEIPETISANLLYQLTGYKRRTIRDLMDKGVIPTSSAGKFPFAETIGAICEYGRRRGGGDMSARDRKMEADAALAEMKTEIMARKLVRADAVDRVWARICADISGRTLMIPSRLGARFGTWPDRHTFEADLEEEVRQCLTELSQKIEYGIDETMIEDDEEGGEDGADDEDNDDDAEEEDDDQAGD